MYVHSAQACIIIIMGVHKHTLLIHVQVRTLVMHICIFILRIYVRSKEVNKCTITCELTFLVKIVNSNVIPTLHGCCSYSYFGAQE